MWKPKSNLRRRRTLSGAEYNERETVRLARLRAHRNAIMKARAKYECRVVNKYCTLEISISDKAKIKHAANGAYVEAWVWVEDGESKNG